MCVSSGMDFFFFYKQETAYEMRISDWSSDVCSSDLVVAAVVRTVVVTPHLEADPQRLLEPLEPLGRRREGHPEAEVLPLVPARSDTEHRAPAGETVEGRHGLRQEPRVAIGTTGDQHAERQPLGEGGDVPRSEEHTSELQSLMRISY